MKEALVASPFFFLREIGEAMPVEKQRGGKTPAKRNVAPRARRKGLRQGAISESVPEGESAEMGEAPVEDYQRHTKKVVSGKFASIMKTMAERSEKGSLPHTKFLFEIGGVKEEIRRRGRGDAEPSLADLLLAEIRKQRAIEIATAVKREAGVGQADAKRPWNEMNEADIVERGDNERSARRMKSRRSQGQRSICERHCCSRSAALFFCLEL